MVEVVGGGAHEAVVCGHGCSAEGLDIVGVSQASEAVYRGQQVGGCLPHGWVEDG